MKTKASGRLSRAGFLSAVLLFGSLAAAQAQGNRYWVGEGTDWMDSANWSTTNGGTSGASAPTTSSGIARFTTLSPLEDRVISLGGQTINLSQISSSSSDEWEITNGTINLGAALELSTGGYLTISANLNLLEGQHNMSQSSTGGGRTRLSGSISGVGSIMFNGHSILEITGTNTSSGGFIFRGGTLEIGTNSAFGSGELRLGIGNSTGDHPVLRSIDSTGRSVANDVHLRARIFSVGSTTGAQTGAITFAGDIVFDDTGTAEANIIDSRTIRLLGQGIFQGDFYSAEGTGEKILKLRGGTSTDPRSMAIFEKTSTRTTETWIGDENAQSLGVTVKADNALGEGDIIVYNSGSVIPELILDGGDTGITLSNHIRPSTMGLIADQYITSLRGDNAITGNVQMHSRNDGNNNSVSTLTVHEGTLTLSGGVSGPSESSTVTLRKTGAGVLSLTGETNTGISRLRVVEGTLRVIQDTSWTTTQALNFASGSSSTATPVLETSGEISSTLGTSGGTISWSADSSGGFAAHGGNLDIDFFGTSSITWGSSNFVSSGSRLILNSATATHRVDFKDGLNLNGNTETVQVLDNPALTGDYARISGVISGTGASHLRKTGDGVLELTNANTYAGGTTIAAGTLLVNNTSGSGTGSGAVTINAGAALGGSGTIAGAVTLSGVHRPGNSPGIQSFGSDLTYSSGASVEWELGANTIDQGAPGSETYDQILVSGILDFSGPVSLTLSFNPAGGTVDWTDDFWADNQSWTIYTTGNPILNGDQLSLVSENWADGFGNLFDVVLGGGSFSLEVSGNDLLLNYAAVPEPSTWALLIGGAAFLLRRRGRLIS